MTIHIAYDDVTLGLIPDDAPLVVAYWDGIYANYDQAVARFGAGRVRAITVRGAHGPHIYWCDSETGDLSSEAAIHWVAYETKVLGRTARGPYAQVSSMQAIVDGLTASGVDRYRYPIWTAHYGAGAHICSPHTCGYPGFKTDADGTQFTETAHGKSLDESEVNNRWLGQTNPDAYPGYPLKYDDKGPDVAHMQNRLINAFDWDLKADGVFGGHTLGAVQVFQRKHGLSPDGIVGPNTWTKMFQNRK